MSDLTISARVGANVRRFRTERDLSLRQLGDLLHGVGLDLSVSGLSRLEQGQRPITVDQLVLLADVLDRSPVELLEQETVVTGGGNLAMRLEQTPAYGLALRAAVEQQDAAAGGKASPDPALLRGLAQILASASASAMTPATLRAIRTIAEEAAGTVAPLVRTAVAQSRPRDGD